jgi:hypothetical protein
MNQNPRDILRQDGKCCSQGREELVLDLVFAILDKRHRHSDKMGTWS